MKYYLDVPYEYQKAKKKMLCFSLIFAFVFSLVILGDALLVIKSGQNYTINLIISIIISIIFIWFAIYFFTTIYQEICNRYRFFKSYESGLKEQEEIEFINCENELNYVNGLYVYPLHVIYKNGLESQNKIIYSSIKLPFKSGDKLMIKTYQRILIEAEIQK